MRVLFSLVAFVAGAHALSSPLHQKRGGSDVCSHVECSVSFVNPLSGKSTNFGDISQCTCLSDVPSLVKSNSILTAAASVFGNSKVTDYIGGQVRKDGSTCHYPDHGVPVCSKENPCGFDCSDGYTHSNEDCVCLPPYKECGGKCGMFPACPSKTPHKRDADEWKKTARCDEGYTACGTFWSSKFTTEAYECVDVKNDLESCGGCSIPLHRGSPLGTDCASLPGVADVSCMNGSCYVRKCMPGYQLSADNSMCMDDEAVKKFTTIAEFGWEWVVTRLG